MKKKIFICAFIISFILTLFPAFASEYSGSVLFGRLTLKIPETGYCTYFYTPYLKDGAGKLTKTDELSLSLSDLPDGVKFNLSDNSVTVYDSANPGDMFTITTKSDSHPEIREKSYTVRLTDNMLVNSTFTDMPYMSGWDEKNSPSFQTDGSMLKIDFDSKNGYTYILTQKDNIPMLEDTLYEFSFEIKSSLASESAVSNCYSEIIGSSAVVYLSEPNYSSWTKVTVPLRPQNGDDYKFSFVTMSEDEASFAVRNLSLTVASGTLPFSLKADIPQAVNIPKSGEISIPFEVCALDLEGNAVPATICYEITPHTDEISFTDSGIAITSDAQPGNYSVHAYAAKYPDVFTDFTLNLTSSGITNGSFELEGSDSLWLAAGDGEYKVIKERGNSYASFTPNAEVGIMYNNAYVSFNEAESYVFSADLKRRFSDKAASVTFIVEDSSDPDNLQLCAYFEANTSWTSHKAVFTPEKDLSGRFIVAVNVPDGFDEQTVYLDNIDVKPAEIRAENVKIHGNPKRGNTLVGTFDFVNNFDGESASLTNWALSDNIDGPYTELSYSYVKELEITEDMEGRYIIFEVTPISLTAGIVGKTVSSSPVKVSSKQTSSVHRPAQKPNTADSSSSEALKAYPEYISPAIPSESNTNVFSDCENHWGKSIINSAYASGIISGYDDHTFRPDINITRAEFSSLVVNSLGLTGGLYSGTFADVSLQSWYAGIIQTMQNCSLINGVTENTFQPNAPITREDAALILIRAYKLIKGDSALSEASSFKDFALVSDYAKDSVSSAHALGIISGDSNGFFLPASKTTRAEAAAMLLNFLKVLKNN